MSYIWGRWSTDDLAGSNAIMTVGVSPSQTDPSRSLPSFTPSIGFTFTCFSLVHREKRWYEIFTVYLSSLVPSLASEKHLCKRICALYLHDFWAPNAGQMWNFAWFLTLKINVNQPYLSKTVNWACLITLTSNKRTILFCCHHCACQILKIKMKYACHLLTDLRHVTCA